jgi:dihydrofolate reductase
MSEPRIALVVAVAKNGVIGREGDLPWRQSSDLKLFRGLTMDKPIVMGRRTWETLRKKPLDGRDNIIVTRAHGFAAPGAIVVHSIEDALGEARRCAEVRGADEIAVIGGAEIYRAVLPYADRLYWTEIHADPVGDTYFPALNTEEWNVAQREEIPQGDKDQYRARLVILERRNA